MAAIRGAPLLAVSSGIIDSDIVLIPAASISRWTSPTDQQYTGSNRNQHDRIDTLLFHPLTCESTGFKLDA
jgi:hypothetical protein